jgi:hypothetical protein
VSDATAITNVRVFDGERLGDPTRDISATRNIRGVWIGGRRVKPNGTT